ncbi:hypothetical protein ANN_19916, partial [Periplaneta americana]
SVNLENFLQPDDVGDYKEFVRDSGTTNCARECKKDGAPRLCYYRFTLEAYATLTDACQNCTEEISQCENVQCVPADGFEKGILTVNRRLPGPSIQVCLGDEIVVDVENKMPARSTTLHWHGIFQRGTQWNDGVPMVTQCAILQDTKFRYNFYANQPGTFYWHSHDGTQKVLGLQGSLVVRRPKEDSPNGKLYDFDKPDHVILVTDWFHRSEEDQFPGMRNSNNYIFTYFLINGRGRYKVRARTQKVLGLQGSLVVRRPKEDSPNGKLYDFDKPDHVMFVTDWFHRSEEDQFPGMRNSNNYIFTYFLINGRGRYKDLKSGNSTITPYTVFHVQPGKRYRFRIIAATCSHCHTRISFEGHNLTLIATDANPVKPVVIDYFDIFSGERYDFVLNATNEIKSYWIKVQGMGPCALDNIYQLAVLQYEGANTAIPTSLVPESDVFNTTGIVLNPENAMCAKGQNGLCVTQLESAVAINKNVLVPDPDIEFVLRMGYYYPNYTKDYYLTFIRITVPRFTQPPTVQFLRGEYGPCGVRGASKPACLKEQVDGSDVIGRWDKPGSVNGWPVPCPGPDFPDTIYWFNNIFNQLPESPPLTQWKDIPADAYCPLGSNGSAVCNKDLCSCFHLLKIRLGAVVEFTILDESEKGGISHPLHLHGFAFNVMDIGLTDDAKNVAAIYKSKQLSGAPVLKDTVAIPSDGYTVLRIVADNPGYWMFHCHFLFHHVAGMSFVIQVGEPEDLPPMPQGIPKCGNFLPPVGNAP